MVVFMANISCIRAGASCLPIVGPFVGWYNRFEFRNDLIGMTEALSRFTGESKTELTEIKNKYLPLAQKARAYHICDIVGNVLSVAAVVGLIALRMLSLLPGVVAAALFAWRAIVSSGRLSKSRELVGILQDLIKEYAKLYNGISTTSTLKP